MAKRIGLVAAFCALAAALAVVVILLIGQGATTDRQAREITQLQHQAASYSAQISALQSSVANLVGEVANPTDPLSAYTDVCQAQLTNDSTGITQTYYYPCTNTAQTIPQPPGN